MGQMCLHMSVCVCVVTTAVYLYVVKYCSAVCDQEAGDGLPNGIGDAKPRSVGNAKPAAAAAAAVPPTRKDSGSDIDTDPFFDDLPKKDAMLYVVLSLFILISDCLRYMACSFK